MASVDIPGRQETFEDIDAAGSERFGLLAAELPVEPRRDGCLG